MIKIAIFTSNELRHDFFRIRLANTKNIKTLFSLVENDNKKKKNYSKKTNSKEIQIIKSHLVNRYRAEKKYFDHAKKKN